MLVLVKLLAKYVIIIYALGSVHEAFLIDSDAELFMYLIQCVRKSTASEPGLRLKIGRFYQRPGITKRNSKT